MALLAAGDTLLVALAIVTAVWIRSGRQSDILMREQDWLRVLLIVAVVQASLLFTRLYDRAQFADRKELAARVLQAASYAAFSLAFLYFWFPGFSLGGGVAFVAALLIVCLVFGWRTVLFRSYQPRNVLDTSV